MDISHKTLPRDVFLYLLVIVVLTMSTLALGSLLFDFVNIYIPDLDQQICWYDSCRGAVNGAIATLVIAFPILVWAWRFLQRDVQENPGKAELKVRKWLLYLTLFIAGMVVIGDLITLIQNWLSGGLTTQFFLKILIVFLIAGGTFYYFLKELHHERPGKQWIVAKVAMGVVFLALIGGVLTSAPWLARERNQDQRRVNDLSIIQGQILTFWTSKARLPVSLDELRDSVSGFVPPTDPVTGQPYEYTRLGAQEFQLCAMFATASSSTGKGNPSTIYPVRFDGFSESWDHDMGRGCFARTIDPQLYPPKS